MPLSEVRDVFNSIKQDKIIGSAACGVAILSLLIAALYRLDKLFFYENIPQICFCSLLAAVTIFFSYILGFVVCWFFITYEEKASFCLHRLASFYRGHIISKESTSQGCGICSKSNCKRHPNTYNPTPWKNLYVNKKFNDSLEQVKRINLLAQLKPRNLILALQ